MQENTKVRCPCCGCRTLSRPGNDEICPVCFWHDDGQGDDQAKEIRGGPNKLLSLDEARKNYAEFGAFDKEFVPNVRPPRDEEI